MRLPITVRSSSLGPTLECPGRLIAVPLVPARPDDESSSTGTAVHYVIARRLVDDFGARAPEGLKAPESLSLDPFAAWVVDFCLDWVRENVPRDWSLMVEVPLEYEYVLSQTVWILDDEVESPIPKGIPVRMGKDGMEFGVTEVLVTSHIDLVALSPDGKRCIAADWKSGRIGADAADNNWQAASYLAQIRQGWDVEHASFTMVQPLIDEDAGVERITTVEKTGDELDALIADICTRLGYAVANRFTTNSGIYQCQYCPVCGPLCPSIQAEKEAKMKAQLTKENIEALRAAPNDAVLSEFVIAGRVLGKAFESAEDVLKERVEKTGGVVAPDGTTITMTTRGGHYSIKDRDSFFASLDRNVPDKADQVKCLKPQMKELREMIAVKQGVPKESKKGRSAKSIFEDEFRPFTEQGVSKILVFK